MWVFPGGKVDPADQLDPADQVDPADQIDRADPAEAVELADIRAARRAALREAREEASLLLDPDTLVLHSWWMPPLEAPRRFVTWFFLAPVGDAPEVVVDGTEIYEHRWFLPSEARQARDRGEISLAPPTWMTLWWLGQFQDTSEALASSAAHSPQRFATRMYPVEGGMLACWAGDVAYEHGDPAAPGARRRLWMVDPSWRAEVDTA
jgi:8-oxo-dGTP pyrophosphatase MutT (NUDIX family)